MQWKDHRVLTHMAAFIWFKLIPLRMVVEVTRVWYHFSVHPWPTTSHVRAELCNVVFVLMQIHAYEVREPITYSRRIIRFSAGLDRSILVVSVPRLDLC